MTEPRGRQRRRGGMTGWRWLLLAVVAVGLVLASAGCSATAGTLVGSVWKLVAVGGQPPVADGNIAFTADGRVSFQTGCNGGGGSYEAEATRLVFGQLMSTMMGCDEARSTQEAAFLAVLNANPSFVITGNQLTLGGGADSLTFEATAASAPSQTD
jgi:heat shock protein HslJ